MTKKEMEYYYNILGSVLILEDILDRLVFCDEDTKKYYLLHHLKKIQENNNALILSLEKVEP